MKQNLLFPDAAASEGPAKRLPHPIPYQGSKRNLAQTILRYFPARSARMVEPFAGSAALSLAAASDGRANGFWLNDAHAPLMALWREIIDRPADLANKYSDLWLAQLGKEREYYDVVRAEFNRTFDPTCFLYLLARCVKAAIRYNSDGDFNNSPDNRRKGAVPKTMRQRIAGASALLKGRTNITAADYSTVLAECDADDVVYMDPPYQGVCGNRDSRYAPKLDRDAFCESLSELNRRKIRYLVSYDGRTGDKVYGTPLPSSLHLTQIEIHAGRSTQATLLGRDDDTYESLYLSEPLAREIGHGY